MPEMCFLQKQNDARGVLRMKFLNREVLKSILYASTSKCNTSLLQKPIIQTVCYQFCNIVHSSLKKANIEFLTSL